MVIAKVLLVVVAMTLDVAVITLEFEILLGAATLVFDAKIQVAPLMVLDVVAIPLEFEKMWFEMLLGTAMLTFVAKIQAGPLMMLDVVAIPLVFEKMWFEMLLEVLTMLVIVKIQAAAGILSKDDHHIVGSHSTVERNSLIVMSLIQFVAGMKTAGHGGRKGEGLQHPFLSCFAKK